MKSATSISRLRALPILAVVLVAAFGSCKRKQALPKADKPVVYVVTSEAGRNDSGFNAVSCAGADRAAEAFGWQVKVLESRSREDYVPKLDFAARNGHCVVALGFMISSVTAQVAARFPAKKFVQIEGAVTDAEGRPSELPNVACYNFASQEAGFLVGLVAGLATRSRKVGVVAGEDIPPVEAYLAGFKLGVRAGADARGKEVDVRILYANSFSDPARGKSQAEVLISHGCDVLFRAAGKTGEGVLQAVREHDGVYLIGEDFDIEDQLPGRILCSSLKRMDEAVYRALKAAHEGTFKSGSFVLGLKEGGVGISPMRYTKKLLPPGGPDLIERYKELIRSGELKVPHRMKDVGDVQLPALSLQAEKQ